MPGGGFIDVDGPFVRGALPAQAQEGRGLAVSEEGDGDVAVPAAEADFRRAEAGPSLLVPAGAPVDMAVDDTLFNTTDPRLRSTSVKEPLPVGAVT